MSKLNFLNRSFIFNWIYRAITSITTLSAFVFFGTIGSQYLDTNLYSGWMGLIGGIATLLFIRILFGSFKTFLPSDSPVISVNNSKTINTMQFPDSQNIKPIFNPQTPLPGLKSIKTPATISNPMIRPNFNLQTAKSRQTTSTMPQLMDPEVVKQKFMPPKRNIKEEIDLVLIKQEKLEKLKDFMDRMDPRLYNSLKRRYSIEKEILTDDLITEEAEAKNRAEEQQVIPSEPSAMEPEVIDIVSNVSQGSKDIKYNELIDRFSKLDQLLTTRLKLMKTKNPLDIDQEQEEDQNISSDTIETVM